MKPTLLFATLTMVFATPKGWAATELETLRARCAAQEQQIHKLEAENRKLQGKAPEKAEQAAVSASTPREDNASTYSVKPGDSIERIANKTGCSPEKLAKLNGLKPSSIIHPGQSLKLPEGSKSEKVPAPVVASTPSEKPAVSEKSATPQTAGKTYKIQENETYSSISRKFKIPVNTLIAANPGIKPTQLHTGQVIRLSRATNSTPNVSTAPVVAKSEPVSVPAPQRAPEAPKPAPHVAETPAIPKSSTATVSAPKPTPQPAPAPAAPAPALKAPESTQAAAPPAEQTPVSNTEKKIRSVTIDGEITYGEFAASHGTSTTRLNDLNGLDLTNATVLAKGSELYVPAQP